MLILVLFNSTEILAWLAGEPLGSAYQHIIAGYPHLQEGWAAYTVKATLIEVPAEDAFRPDLYEVAADKVVRKS